MEILYALLRIIVTPVGFFIFAGGFVLSLLMGSLAKKSGPKLLHWLIGCLLNLYWVVGLEAGFQYVTHSDLGLILGLILAFTTPFGIGWLLGLLISTATNALRNKPA